MHMGLYRALSHSRAHSRNRDVVNVVMTRDEVAYVTRYWATDRKSVV